MTMRPILPPTEAQPGPQEWETRWTAPSAARPLLRADGTPRRVRRIGTMVGIGFIAGAVSVWAAGLVGTLFLGAIGVFAAVVGFVIYKCLASRRISAGAQSLSVATNAPSDPPAWRAPVATARRLLNDWEILLTSTTINDDGVLRLVGPCKLSEDQLLWLAAACGRSVVASMRTWPGYNPEWHAEVFLEGKWEFTDKARWEVKARIATANCHALSKSVNAATARLFFNPESELCGNVITEREPSRTVSF